MPTIEEMDSDTTGAGTGTDNSSSAPPPSAPTGSGVQGLIGHVMSNKIEAALWVTRILTVFFSISFMLPIFGGNAHAQYGKALMASAATSALRLHQRMPNFQFSREYFGLLFLEDSAHYLFYSIIFMNNAPITMVLIPVFLFALLHATTYTLQLLDKIGPNSIQMVRNLINKLKFHQTNILRFIAMNEIFMMPACVLMIFSGSAFLLLPFVYYRFLSLRYASRRNPYSRQLFYELRVTVEYYTGQDRCPAAIRNIVSKVISFISRLAPVVQAA